MNSWFIPTPTDFNFEEVCWFLDRGYDDCLHKIENQSILKLLEIQQQKCLIKIKKSKQQLQVELLTGAVNNHIRSYINTYIKNWFDLERDLSPFYQKLNQHSALAQQVIKHRGLRLISILDLFEALSWAIIGQQINLTFAYQLKRNLVENYGDSLSYQKQKYFLFPQPVQIAHCSIDSLKQLKFSTRKAEYLIGIAELMLKGELSKKKLLELSDTSSIITELCKIRGIGEWTANYTSMKCLKRMDSVPYGDAGLIKAIQLVDQLENRPNRVEQELFFRNLTDWEAYTTLYLWQSLSK